jgi:hypothetical protein
MNGRVVTVPKISPLADPSQIFKKEYPANGLTITSSWVRDPDVQDPILFGLGIKYNTKPGKQNQKKTKELGGKFISRNDRIISRQEINKPGAGDNWKQNIAVHTRHVVNFAASVEMDTLFGVSVNKSNLDQTKMDKSIKKKINEHIAEAQKHFENVFKTLVSPESETETESDPESVTEYNPQPTASRSIPVVDFATESESDTSQESETDPEPSITFTMLTGANEIIIKHGDQVLYNVPCPKSSRAAFKKIFEHASKNENFRRYVEAIIEANSLVVC